MLARPGATRRGGIPAGRITLVLSFQLILVLGYLGLLACLVIPLIALLKSIRSSANAKAIHSLTELVEAGVLSEEEFKEKSRKLFKRL